MKPLFIALTGGIVLSIAAGCHKDPDTAPAPPAADTTTAAPKAVSWIDSLTGTYYGHTSRAEEYYDAGILKKRNQYDGPDTVIVVKRDSVTVDVTSAHIWTEGGIRFDTSRNMHGPRSVATMSVNSRYDSLSYHFSVSAVPPNTYCNFSGRKK